MVRGLGSRQNAKPRTPCTTMTLVKCPESQMTKSWTHLCLEVSLGLRRGILSPDRLELLCKVGLAHVALLRYRRHHLLACKARAFDRRLPANAGGGGVRWGPGDGVRRSRESPLLNLSLSHSPSPLSSHPPPHSQTLPHPHAERPASSHTHWPYLSPIVMNDGALKVCWNMDGPVPVCASRYSPGFSSSFFGISDGCSPGD